MTKFVKRIISRKGFTYVLLTAIIIAVLLIGVAIFEVIRINIQAAAVRDKFEDAVISVCVDNYSQLYQTVREGYAASYGGSKDNWLECSNTTEAQIRQYLNDAMNNGEIIQCDIISVDYTVTAAELAPGNADSQKFAIDGEISLKIPYRFAWSELVPIRISYTVKSQWRAKF